MEKKEKTIKKHATPCCAMALLYDLDNNTSSFQLNGVLGQLKKEKENNTEVGYSTGKGQTLIQVVVSPGEDRLRETLKNSGFAKAFDFERRVGYPKEDLEMFIRYL